MEDYRVELDAETGMRCTLLLFADVANAREIRERVTSDGLRCCVTKATLVVDAFQAIVAANKAALNAHRDRLVTRNVYTEILYCLSMSKNISRSLSEFGIGDGDRNVLAILLHESDDEGRTMLADLLDVVEGERVPVSRIREFADESRVKQSYKITEEELRVTSLVDAIVSRISGKELSLAK